MKAVLSRRFHFSASHRLHAESLSAAENQEAFGKCNNPHGHGHNYKVTVRLSGRIDPATGMVANLAEVDRFVEEKVLSDYHLANLNTLQAFSEVVPTTENLAIELYRILKGFGGATLLSVHIEETGNNSFTYGDVPFGSSGQAAR